MKRPLAYVTAAWRGGECEVMEQAAKYCRIDHAQGGSAQVAEDEHPVEEGVGQHGHAEDDHAQLGVLHGAVGAHVHTGEAVENIGEAHDAGVLSRQGYQLLVVGEKAHQLLRQEEHDGGKGQGDLP